MFRRTARPPYHAAPASGSKSPSRPAILFRVFLPILLILLASVSGALLAYGTHDVWAEYSHGIDFIMLVRRLEWPIAALALIMCLALIALVIAGKRRAWWLLGLGPVLGLFLHHLYRDPYRGLAILDNPAFVSAAVAAQIADDDYVVGLTFADQAYAYPLNRLYLAPVIFQTDQTRSMMLIWSAYANRASAWYITRDLRAGDIEIVSMPANALLLYNTKLGQFVDGVSATTRKGEKPAGFSSPISTSKMPWSQWRRLHPQTRVLVFDHKLLKQIRSRPLYPSLPMPKTAGKRPDEPRVLVLATSRPAALPMDQLTRPVMNIRAGGVPIVLFRDPRSGHFAAFERQIERDLIPLFEQKVDASRPLAACLVDRDTATSWSSDGRALDGDYAKTGKRLKPVPLEEDLYWGVMKFWMPQLELLDPAALK